MRTATTYQYGQTASSLQHWFWRISSVTSQQLLSQSQPYSSGLPPWEAPMMIAKKHKLLFPFLFQSQQVSAQQLRSHQSKSASIGLSLRGLTHLGCDYQGWRQPWEILCKERGYQGVLGIVLGTRQILLVKPEYVVLALWGTTGVCHYNTAYIACK